jgi:organic radical activating enzyme
MIYKRVDIKTGFLCNNNCLFCVQANNKLKGNRSFEDIKKDLTDSKKRCEGIVLTGGEVTIRKDFIQIVEFAKELGYTNIQIQTNGRMFSSMDFCKKVINAGATEISPALHGYCKEQHNYLTQTEGAFNETVKGIINMKKLGARILTNTVIVKSNYRSLDKIAHLLVKLKVDQFQFAFVHAMGNAWSNYDSIVPRMSLVMPSVFKGLDIGINASVRVMTEAIPYCLMKGYEKFLAEKNTDLKKNINSFFLKSKKEYCNNCFWIKKCDGKWKDDYVFFYNDKSKQNVKIYNSSHYKEILKSFKKDPLSFNFEKDNYFIDNIMKFNYLDKKNVILFFVFNTVRAGQVNQILETFDFLKIKKIYIFFQGLTNNIDFRLINNISNLEIIDKKKINKIKYDYLISFSALDFINQNIKPSGKIVSFFTNLDFSNIHSRHNSNKNYIYDHKIYCHNLFEKTLTKYLERPLALNLIFCEGISWPPDVNIKLLNNNKQYLFDYAFLGNRDRNYEFLYNCKDLFKNKKILVLKGEKYDKDQEKYIELLKKEKNFIFINDVWRKLYVRLIILTKVFLVFFKGKSYTDYTSISDVIWFGKPVITNEVKATKHMETILLFSKNKMDVKKHIKNLNDDKYYFKISKKIRKYATNNINLLNIWYIIYKNIINEKYK